MVIRVARPRSFARARLSVFPLKKIMPASFSTDARRKAGKHHHNALLRKARQGTHTALGQGSYYRFGNEFLKEFKLDRCIPGRTINGLQKFLNRQEMEEGLRLRAGSIQGTA
jgi:hypothetical protein